MIPVLVLIAAAGAALWFFGSDDDPSGDRAATPVDEQQPPAEAVVPLPDDICTWITPQQLMDAGFAEVSSQGPGIIRVDDVTIPTCGFVLRPGDRVAVRYSVHQPPDQDPEEMLSWRLSEAREIEGLGDVAAFEWNDPRDPERTAFKVAVSVGGQNLLFNGDTRAADVEATIAVVRFLVDQMRAGAPGD